MFAKLEHYWERFGNCDVPHSWEENPPLAIWVSNQRARQLELSSTRRARLDELGFVWDPREVAWEKMFAKLMGYKSKHGDCNVPQDWSEDLQLGRWVSAQHVRAKQGTLPPEQKARLDALGFDWGDSQASKRRPAAE
jgi:Helicase associated domain